VLDQVAVAAGAVGAQATQHLHRFEQVGFALPVGTDHQQPGSLQGQLQPTDIAKTQQLQAVQPDGSDAVSG
jgi:hypothetical protein